MQYTEIFLALKNENFQLKKFDIFLILRLCFCIGNIRFSLDAALITTYQIVDCDWPQQYRSFSLQRRNCDSKGIELNRYISENGNFKCNILLTFIYKNLDQDRVFKNE